MQPILKIIIDLLNGPMARLASLLLAIAFAGVISVYPSVLVSGEQVNHGMLMLLMWGISAGFVHGVGFVPVHGVMRLLLGPMAAWLLMGGGLIWVLSIRAAAFSL